MIEVGAIAYILVGMLLMFMFFAVIFGWIPIIYNDIVEFSDGVVSFYNGLVAVGKFLGNL